MKFSKKTKIIIFGIIGFFITGVLLYPYGIMWDSALVIKDILKGHALLNNWLGWYFPLIWEGLYRLTGVVHIMGSYILLLYWIGITILYINLFNVEKHSLWWYFLFAWFPGTLLFVLNITNNALMFVMMILGISFFAIYSNKKHWIWAVLSILTIIQCLFIRRESFIMVVPLVIMILYIVFLQNRKKWLAALYSIVIGLTVFIGIFFTEKTVTSKIPNYEYIDTMGFTCLFDMSAVTYLTGQMQIPNHIFKEEYADGKACFNRIMKTSEDSIWNGDIVLKTFVCPYTNVGYYQNLSLPKSDIKTFYSNNFLSWLKFRAQYSIRYFWFRQCMCYTVKADNWHPYSTRNPKTIQVALSYVFPLLLGSLQFFYFLSIIFLFFDWKKWVSYRNKKERLFLFGLIVFSLFETGIVLLFSVDVQYRYLYPVCMLQYLIFVYVMSRLKYGEIVTKLLR